MFQLDAYPQISTDPYLLAPSVLSPLPYPIYFVTRDSKWQDLLGKSLPEDIQPLLQRCETTQDIWSAQTYMLLRQRSLGVHLVSRPVPGRISIVPYYYLNAKELSYNSYVVAVFHDCARPEICEQWIVLNPSQVSDHRHHYITHWPQPNLKPRAASRETRLENLVFKGRDYNLDAIFKTPTFLSQLTDLGIRLLTGSAEQLEQQFEEWRDYTEADVVIAVRNNTHYDISRKPPLKLINAWFAGCPAILGPEPAYQALRKSKLDYIEVRTPDEAIAALKQLQDNPRLYSAMVKNGFQRAQEFTPNQTAQRWRELLAGPITVGYEQWLHQSALQKLLGRPLQFAARRLKHRSQYQDYVAKIHEGPRILYQP
jgi:hypothetical protein